MATLKNSVSGESCLLRAQHVFGRDEARCDTVTPGNHVSRMHACIRFKGGRWELRDQSRNGTLLSGTLLRDGEHATLREGDTIRFGKATDVCWHVDDLSDPADMLWPVRAPARPIVLDSAHMLSGDATPAVMVVRSSSGEWLCDDRGELRVLRDGDLVTTGNLSWRLTLAHKDSTLALAVPAGLSTLPQRIEFTVSSNEEHVRAVLHTRGGTVDLGERSHHYSLATLARARFADMQTGYDSASQGWVEVETLARMLGIDVPHVNVHIHRARAQFAALPGNGAIEFVERRRGSVRFGCVAFRVFRGERLECQWLPAEPAHGFVPHAAHDDLMLHALPT
ncbi:FHA domain-containing protein [Trinickia terrae]|uniref:FHA domain-containing protein n=1 Tax=Trinickia terrae TaxID=2571161 RepID=A0A4U1HYH3_9BURK|nr:FHA domain-containing protein [Trinickia terrae]TKC86003.1 FHA domain-containing protein [Trinickia terrae]